MERDLSEDDRRALRGSKFAPLPALPSRSQPRLAHPNGPMATNKAAALAKFLERKLQQPGGLNSLDPNHLEIAVNNAKATVNASNGGASSSGVVIRHVSSFGGSTEEPDGELEVDNLKQAGPKKKKKKKKNKMTKKTRDQDRESKISKKKKKKKHKKFAREQKAKV